MRKYLAAALAVPVLLLIYAASIVRRPSSRIPIALVALGMASMLVGNAVRPAPASGVAPSHGSTVAPADFSTPIAVGQSAHAAIEVSFPSPMNGASVEANLSIDPATAINLAWDAATTHLTVTPQSAWAVGTLHTITVEAGALDAKGSPLDHRVRAVFLTRGATTAALTAAPLSAGRATGATHFRVAFTGPIDATSIALQFSPALAGRLVPATGSTELAPVLEFVPSTGLAANVTYQVSLAATARDADGFAVVAAPTAVPTAAAPAVVRFRPLTGAKAVAWTQNLSVRFSEPMDHATTQAAWSATQAVAAIAGAFSWAENDTVLIFNPTSSLGYAQKISLAVASSAISRAGLHLRAAGAATFTTAAKPSTGTHRTSGGGTSGGGSSGGSGGSIGGSTWAAVEAYYLKLMNCTRTGGWVTSTGACSSPGGRAVKPLWQDAGITARVSRPYAKKLAVSGVCSHFSGGTPGDRLRAAGYTSYVWAENLGCQSGDPYRVALNSQIFFQSEKSYNGGHYVNLMNAKYDRVGIGIWSYAGRVRVVIDFYHPL